MPNNFQPHIPDFQRGERLSAARLNELADAIAKILWQKQQSSNAAFGVKMPLEIIGKLDDDLPAATDFSTSPGTAVMSVWIRDTSGNLIDSGRNENVRQRIETATDLEAGAQVKARWIEGEWMVDSSSGGGGGESIWFTIDEVVCDPYGVEETYLVVTPIYYTGGCSGNVPGSDSYGQVEVYDICSFFSEHVADGLPGTKGKATYMYPMDGGSYCEPRWIIDMLCNQPECA